MKHFLQRILDIYLVLEQSVELVVTQAVETVINERTRDKVDRLVGHDLATE